MGLGERLVITLTKEDTFIGAPKIINLPLVKQAEKCLYGVGERLVITPTKEDTCIGAAEIINLKNSHQ
jgi:hypothetical protein